MVNDDVVVVHRSQTVTLMIGNKLIAQAETHITEDDIVAGDDKRMIGYADAVARSCLSGNGDITVLDLQFRGQVDRSRHIKDNRSRTFLIQSIAKRTRLVVVLNGRHMINLTATTAGSVHSETFCSRKCRRLVLGTQAEASCHHQAHHHHFFVHAKLFF